MYIREILRRGVQHKDFCQDATYFFEDENIIAAGIFDGCSNNTDREGNRYPIESHFASNFLKRAFRCELTAIAEGLKTKDVFYFEEYIKEDKLEIGIEAFSKEVLYWYFHKIGFIWSELNLTTEDMSSTCILLFYDKIKMEGIIYAFGDGYLRINNEEIIIDHENSPDIFTTYWKELTQNRFEFDFFIKDYEQIWRFNELKDVTISSDGILSYRKKESTDDNTEAIDFLLADTKNIHQNVFFQKKHNILEFDSWEHTDDLGIIRIVKENV